MVRKTRQFRGLAGMALGSLAIIALSSLGQTQTTKDTADQRLKQQITQSAAEELVHRIGTMLRVMEYYQPDKTGQRQTLEIVANTLAGLSREQMEDVLQMLDKAAHEPDPAKSSKELEQAHARHVEIMQTLRALLAQYESLSTIDQIGEKLDKLSKNQLELVLQGTRLGKAVEWNDQNFDFGIRGKGALSPTQLRNLELAQFATEQSNLRDDVDKTLKKADDLLSLLPFDQKSALNQLLDAVEESELKDKLKLTNQKLDRIDDAWGNEQIDRVKKANTLQREAAETLKDLACILRQPKDNLAALRRAQEQLDETIEAQIELQARAKLQADKDAKEPPTFDPEETLEPVAFFQKGKKGGKGGGFFDQRDGFIAPPQSDRGAREMSEQQARLWLDVREPSNLLMPIDGDLAELIDNARLPLRSAEEALREATFGKAVPQQEKALDALKKAREQIAKMIAKLEEQRRDPLAALKEAAETIEKLLKEQITTRDTTKDIAETKQSEKLPEIAPQQKDLANRTDALNSKPLPNPALTQKSLDKAARAMDNAAKNLQEQKAPDAVAKQNDAIKSLEDAQKSLKQQIAEIEKRREDMAKLEDAAQKLAQLTKDEIKIADQAVQKTAQPSPDTKNLAKDQGKLTPQAKDLARSLDKLAPKAADKVDMGAQNMDQARKDLEKNLPQPGADEANKAVDRLKEAANELSKKLDELKAKELADQAAMKLLDPKTLAQQLQKAIDQTKQAMQQSDKVQNQDMQKSLADLQKAIADKAQQMKLDKAAPPAFDAAKALQKGDLKKALDSQQQALDKLQQAAKGDKGDKGDKGQGKDGQQGDAKQVAQLAQQQKDLMNAVKQLAQQQAQKAQQGAQKANQNALQTLGQAMAGAPKGIQLPMQLAAGNLGKAGQQLKQGTPKPANQSQQQAMQQMQSALKQLQAADALAKKKGDGKDLAKGKDGKGKDGKDGKGKDGKGKDGKGKDGKGKDGKKQGQADELKNKGDGNRLADGKVSNTQSQLLDVMGADLFLQLPPRQRELIRQALAGELPPDYAVQIQQYFLNISRGQSGGGGGPPPAPPGPPGLPKGG